MQFQQTASQRVNGRRSSSRGVNEQSPTAESGGEFPVSTETAAVQAPPLTQNVVPSPMNRIARKRPNSAIVEMSTRQESGRWVGDSFCAKHFAQIQNPPAQPIKRASSVQSIVRRSRVRARHRNWMLRITTPVQYSGILGKVFGIGKNSKLGYRSNLIHPSSPFSLFALFVSISLLLYLAIVMLVEIGFFWDSELCAESLPTFTFDIFVDCWFMFEILLCFFTGIYIDGRYHDEIRVVATKYVVSGALLFDVVTCVPETLIEFILRANYCSEDSIDREQQRLQELQIIQAMRLLRIFRLLRSIRILYRLGESISDVTVMIDKLYIPTFVVRMLSALFRIFLITHFCACIFWLIKTVSYTKEEMLFFEEAFEIYPDLDLVEKLSRKYVISFYYVNTIFTTVGFGDIVPHNTAERLLTVLLQHIGLVVFGFLLSEVQDIVGDEMSQSRDRDKLIQHARKFLQDHEVPPELMSRVIHWVKFDFSLRQRRDEQDEILDHIPPVMRRLIYVHLHQGLLNRIPFMTCISKFLREDILTDLFSRMQSEAFPKWLPISTVHGNQAHGLIVITKGIISAEYNDQLVSSLQPGDFFGENSLLVSYFWSTSRGVPAEYICETVAECLVLTRESFDQTIQDYPESLRQEIMDLRLRTESHLNFMRHELEKKDDSQVLNEARWWCMLDKLKCRQSLRTGSSVNTNHSDSMLADIIQGMHHSNLGQWKSTWIAEAKAQETLTQDIKTEIPINSIEDSGKGAEQLNREDTSSQQARASDLFALTMARLDSFEAKVLQEMREIRSCLISNSIPDLELELVCDNDGGEGGSRGGLGSLQRNVLRQGVSVERSSADCRELEDGDEILSPSVIATPTWV